MCNIAILGGTFNPIHCGHLLLAETALRQVALDQIIWVPTYHPPHKPQQLVSFEHRLEMIRLAIAAYPNFAVSDIESQRSSLTFAIDTFTDLQVLHPLGNWHWIIGMDAFQTLPRWKGVNILAQHCVWLVAPRHSATDPTQRINQPTNPNALTSDICQKVTSILAARSISLRWRLLQMHQVEISSSLIRHRCQQHEDLGNLVPEMVKLYITKHKLYAK